MVINTKNHGTIILTRDILERSPDLYLKKLKNLVIDKPPKILLDCSELRQVISGHINILWQSRLICEQAQIPLYLANAGPGLIRVLKILDLFSLFKYNGTIKTIDEGTVTLKPLKNGIAELNIEFRCLKNDIQQSQSRFRKFLYKLGLSPKYVHDLETIFYEVAVNISDHSHMSENKTIKFSAVPKDDRIILSFLDYGQPFDPTQINSEYNPAEAAAGNQKRGYGLIMINRMADRISYSRKENSINVLTLEKCWR